MIALVEKMRSDGLLDQAAAEQVRSLTQSGQACESAILQAGGLSEEALHAYLSGAFALERIDLKTLKPAPDFVAQFPVAVLLKHQLLPLDEADGQLRVATSRPTDRAGLDELRMATGKTVRPVLAPAQEITRHLGTSLGVGADTLEVLVSEANGDTAQTDAAADVVLDAEVQDASIITLVNQVLSEAIDRRATDVHIEPFEKSMRVRYRIDGVLQETPLSREVHQFHAAIVSRLKILSQLDIAEKRVPQDGRVKLRIGTRELDVRVSVIPMLHGEAIVMRLLDRTAAMFGLEHLGMAERDRMAIDRVLELPHGIVLVTGPTGSGKTTTLYAGLTQINDIQRKIVTIEDPVEYHLHGINQIQVNTKAGLTFATGLRSILRHDPDVVLIGEIRDHETAEIAVQASLTGHLVFSTLHTNDAPSATVRLIDMGVESYLVASTLEVVMAQRLVRTICPHCREEYIPHDIELLRQTYGSEMPDVFVRGRGCNECRETGYLGRTGIFEIMPVSDRIRTLVMEHAAVPTIRRQARLEGMRSLREDGWRLLRNGQTTVEEVLRVTKEEAATEQTT
ncbi:MAG: type II/IV secretion system protein [Phycisphaera sp.]|nr:type II/IV secretion system protein [Phycisphaera sp.]